MPGFETRNVSYVILVGFRAAQVPHVVTSHGAVGDVHNDTADDDWREVPLGVRVQDDQLIIDPVGQLMLSILMFSRITNYLRPGCFKLRDRRSPLAQGLCR